MERCSRKEKHRYGNWEKIKRRSYEIRIYPGNSSERINVSRQTISNWENEKSYPDIISVIELSSLYSISLDDLLKGDERMMEHLEESTNVVKSNQKLIGAIILNIITVILLITLSMFLPDKIYYLIMVFCLAIVSSAVLLYQIIRRI